MVKDQEIKEKIIKVCGEELFPRELRRIIYGKVIGEVTWESEFDSHGGEVVIEYYDGYYLVPWYVNKRTMTQGCWVDGPYTNIDDIVEKIAWRRSISSVEEVRKRLHLE